MTLNHSKTWPVSTLAVVQLRVDPNGRTYSTQFDGDLVTDFQIQQANEEIEASDTETTPSRNGITSCNVETHVYHPGSEKNDEEASSRIVLPLSQHHVELFTVQQQQQQHATEGPNIIHNGKRHPHRTTVRTDTVSTILEQDNDIETVSSLPPQHLEIEADNDKYAKFEKFHVLALTRIEEHNEAEASAKTPTVHVENWDHIYNNEAGNSRSKLCPACTAAAAARAANYKQKHSPSDYNERLLVDLPLDARKATTLRRHYYPEGGWGWVIITCTVLVHVLNVGVQLSCSQLAPAGAEKFKTTSVHIAGTKVDRRGETKTLTFEDGLQMQSLIKADDFIECSAKEMFNIDKVFNSALLASLRKPKARRRVFDCTIL